MPPNLSSSPALTHSSESSSHALHDLAHFTPAQKQRLIEQMERDGKFQQLLSRVASISGAGWKGWEKGVNGALSSIGDGFTATGKLIGESAAIAVHGKE